jgi:hypothetical protein
VDDLVDDFFEDSHFMNKCLKLKCKMEVIMAPYLEMHKDMQKKAKQSKINSFFNEVFSVPLHHALCFA